MNSKERFIESKEHNMKEYFGKSNSSEEKIKFIKEVISKENNVNRFYNRESLDTNFFDKCNRDFVETEKGRFVHNVKSEVTSFEINHLKNQNILLKQLIAELSHENELLKNKLFSPGNGTYAK